MACSRRLVARALSPVARCADAALAGAAQNKATDSGARIERLGVMALSMRVFVAYVMSARIMPAAAFARMGP